ncbi:MAG TPA: bacillithiol system redox-active protein YtxJ [Pyrinomonadaceae bacterium]|jgi:bacillithiol system protein YtxJ|nr:bacillithiol system redox-active protein YtxJ [Pyrinomonadaceae bacterium]
MNTPFVEIDSVAALEEFLKTSNGSAVTLFKHSNMCGVSARAYREMSTLDFPVAMVVVQQARPVSDEIEKRWHVDHETPQVLIVNGDRVVWNASHFEIKAADVAAAFKAAGTHQ